MSSFRKRTSRDLSRASQFLRIQKLHRLLADGRLVTSRSLAREFEVSARTCKRDVEFLRDQCRAPIEWRGGLRSYVYTEPYDFFEHARLTAEEALALAMASKVFSGWGSSQLGKALEAALGKLTDFLADHASVPLSDIARLISEPPLASEESGAGLDWFQPLLDAIRRRRVVRLLYRKPSDAAAEAREIHPLHLALLEKRWVLVARDPARGGIRKFVLSRIQKLDVRGEDFEPPDGFDVASYLRGSFGHFAGDEVFHVAIRFARELAPFIAEKKWHPSQRIEPLLDGALIARFELSSLEDIRRWILGWGSRAETLEPAELREAVAAEHRKAGSLYE